jgi:hypothetical protein
VNGFWTKSTTAGGSPARRAATSTAADPAGARPGKPPPLSGCFARVLTGTERQITGDGCSELARAVQAGRVWSALSPPG